jgi:O-antigen/teichoic acid export membrane protein
VTGLQGAAAPVRSLRRLALDASGALLMRGLRMSSSFVLSVAIARLLGASGAGVYFVALATAQLAHLIARLGLDTTLMRTFASGQGSNALYRRAVAVVAGLGVAVGALLAAAAPALVRWVFHEPALTEPLRVMAISIAPWSLLMVHGSLLQSTGRVALAMFVQHVGVLVTGIPLVLVLGAGGSLVGVAAAHTLSTVIILAVGVGWWRRVRNDVAPADLDLDSLWPRVLRSGLAICLIELVTTGSTIADTFLLGALGTAEDVGVFKVAFRVAVLGTAAFDAVRVTLAPRIASGLASGDLETVEQTARRGALVTLLLSLPAWLVVALFPRQVLLLFGPEFTAGATALLLLMVGRVTQAVAGPTGLLLVMGGHERALRDATVVLALARVALLWAVIPRWGLVGAAAAIAVCDVASIAVSTIQVRRFLRMTALPLPRSIVPYGDRLRPLR